MALNILQTIVQTFNRINGYTYAKMGDKDLEEDGPAKGKFIEIKVKYENDDWVNQKKPVVVRIERIVEHEGSKVLHKRIDLSYQDEMYEGKPIITMAIKAFDRKVGTYRETMSTNGQTTKSGNKQALQNCQNDPMIAQYIDFVENDSKARKRPVWELAADMKKLRE